MDFGLVLIKINIPKNMKGVGLLIENFSMFPKEEEFLIQPFSKLKLKAKDDKTNYYHINEKFEKLIKKKYEFDLILNNNELNLKQLKVEPDHKIPLIENEYEFLSVPEIDYDCEFLINSKKICDITSQMQIFGSDIKIQCCEDFIEFTSNGTSGEMIVNLITDDLDEFTIEVDKNFTFSYNLNYLNKMCLTKNLSDKIYFKLSQNCPLKIKYDLDDDNIDINFYVSPKLDID
jgi:proliferating cell nuclear antigen PCNA